MRQKMKGDGSKPIPTRFPIPEIARMDAAAAVSGLGTRATLVKFCVKVFLDDLESRGLKALPRNWKEIVDALDNRTSASREAAARSFRVAEQSADYGSRKKRNGKNGGKGK